MSQDRSASGERELPPRAPGALFPWVKRASLIELAIFAGLLLVWLLPGLEDPTFWLGLSHGIGFILLCLMIWAAVMRREAPFWLLAAALTPAGPVGSTIGIEFIERQHRKDPADLEQTSTDTPPPVS
jgi:hypothetical protein